MSGRSSYRQILRSSSITGGASIINIIISMLRTKLVAVLLGPAGLGFIGLLQALMNTASIVAAVGFGTVGTRQIAESAGSEDVAEIVAVRRALFWGTLLLSVVGGVIFWALRDVLAAQVLHDPAQGSTVGWLAIGVALTVASGSQGALLNGMRRISDLAFVSIGSALCSTVLGIAALVVWGERGVLFFVVLLPLSSFLLGSWHVSRLPPIERQVTPMHVLTGHWKTMLRLGAAFMVSGVLMTAAQLVIRTLVQRELGVEAVGYFQAAWVIAMTYLGFVLGAMGTDYYPRLTATMHDRIAVNKLVNEQSEVALLLAGPVLLTMLGLAPWVIELLYSRAFGGSIIVLEWSVLGDVLKVVSWPLGYLILAAGDGRTYLLSQSVSVVIYVGLTWIGLPLMGIGATGVAFFGMYVIGLPMLYYLAWRRTGFQWQGRVFWNALVLLVLALAVFLAALWSKWLGAGFGVIAALMLALYGLVQLGNMADIGGPVGRISRKSHQLMTKIGGWRD